MITLSPGTDEYQAAKHCECCAAVPTDGPFGPRNTIGQPNQNPDKEACTIMQCYNKDAYGKKHKEKVIRLGNVLLNFKFKKKFFNDF